MAVREFDSTDDQITVNDGGIGSLVASAFSVVALLKPATATNHHPIVCIGAGTSDYLGFSQNYDQGQYDNTSYAEGVNVGITASAWQVIGMNVAAGPAQPRMHRKVLGSGSWTHLNVTNSVTAETGTPTGIRFGTYFSASDFLNGRLATLAIWRSALSDGNFESIESNASTAWVLNNLSPFAMWDFNQANVADGVLDLVGSCDQTAITGTTVVNGDDPAWTFGFEGPVVPTYDPTIKRILFTGFRGR